MAQVLQDQSICADGSLGQKSLSKAIHYEREHYMLESCLNMLIDVSSIFDLISDIIILRQLILNNHTSWLTLSIFTMLCPYFAVYTSLMNFLIDQNKKIRKMYKNRCFRSAIAQFGQVIIIFPTGLFMLILYDVLYTIANTLVLPLLIFCSMILSRNFIQPFEKILDDMM